MAGLIDSLRSRVDALLPEESPRRKVVQVVSVVLLFEGVSVLSLYSYFGLTLGIVSILVGLSTMLLLYRAEPSSIGSNAPIGLKLMPRICSLLGGDYVFMSLGFLIVIAVVIFNMYSSPRPDYGDVDTITILFGLIVIAYPFISSKAFVESSFALIFIGLVFLFLALPQGITAITGGWGSSDIGSWYVHYMLAAPFAGSLDLLGIHSTSVGDTVTIEFQDGSVHSLVISAYCAGLYSFSIFLAAFMAFILVFEKLAPRRLIIVLLLGLGAAYLGNLLRMVLIGVIGYYEGMDAFLWAHRNIGWVVFLGWSTLFWWFIIRYAQRSGSMSFSPKDEEARSDSD